MIAITRGVSPAFADCELTHLSREPIDLGRARRQHAAYEAALEALGCRLERLPADPGAPDCVFVEDTAVVLDELAILTCPGAESRRREVGPVASALARHRQVVRLESEVSGEPATLDGGDVLRVGRRLFVGRSARSGEAAAAALRGLVAPHGYSVELVELRDCLHLKTAVTEVAEGVLLANPRWVDLAPFAGTRIVAVDSEEPFAANALRIGVEVVLHAAAYPRTRRRLQAAGVQVRTVEVDELAKAEGGVTCCSIVLAE